MKNKAFTLIELLAVIVILVVIALIATSIIINIIEKSKKSVFEDSVYGVMEAAKIKYTENILDNKSEEKTYLIEDGLRELEYSGKVDGRGVLKIDKEGKIELAIYNDKWCIRKSKEESKLEVEEYKDKCMIPGIAKDPVITLNGEVSITLKSGEVYEEQGVIAKTVEGKELEYTTAITLNDIVVESIDTSKTGTYKITYSTSSNGKTVTTFRILIVKGENIDKTGANVPDITNGLIPIKWNGENWIKADSDNVMGTNQWYDYNKQMWANAVAVTEEYRNIEVGTVIPEEAVLAYFVWIPRYEYDYVNIKYNAGGISNSQPGEIKINFIKGTSKTATENYKVHPAFTFGSEELEGIWVGKFETSTSPASPCYGFASQSYDDCMDVNPYIKPNMAVLIYQNVNTQFLTAQKFSANENIYGIKATDSHMMKNSEWGAVAYLSQSKYGKYGNSNYIGVNKEVYINNYWNSYQTLTGCSGGSPSASQSTTCAYTYEKENTGTGASTTGTVYGVYDMSGGTSEHVMGIYRGPRASSIWGASTSSNMAGFNNAPEEKYYDEYKNSYLEQACNGEICYGHALSETGNWYNDNHFYFVNYSQPWLTRGGFSVDGERSGIFAFERREGVMGPISFRVTLVKSNNLI